MRLSALAALRRDREHLVSQNYFVLNIGIFLYEPYHLLRRVDRTFVF
jgi:hypothetical protein